MHIAVLLAGVADPKKPLPTPASGDWRDLRDEPAVSYKLSPFDEAALEIALKLRDRHAGAHVTAVITDGAADVAVMRAVAALRPDRVLGLHTPARQRGNPAWLSRHIAELLWNDRAPPDLILIGREHGDLDDGMIPPYLAEAWGLPYAALALQAQAHDWHEPNNEHDRNDRDDRNNRDSRDSRNNGDNRNDRDDGDDRDKGDDRNEPHDRNNSWTFTRSAASRDELLRLPSPALASVSNDKGNRLRHPLMKNVLLAKQQRFEQAQPEATEPATLMLLARAAPVQATTHGMRSCHMLEGSTSDQARALVAYLKSPLSDGCP